MLYTLTHEQIKLVKEKLVKENLVICARLKAPNTLPSFPVDKFSLKSFPLTSRFICSCVQHKLTSFSLTRSIVQKLVMPAFEQGKLFVHVRPARKTLSIQANVRTSSSRKTCPAVHASKQNLSRKSCGKNIVHCTH